MKNIEALSKQTLLVFGDMMVDKYIMGNVERISPEAPVPVLLQRKVDRKLGGAGNVIVNAVSLGASARVVGCVGNDLEGTYFRETLQSLGVDDRYLFTFGSTIVKTRVSASNQQFLRIDEETIVSPSEEIVSKITAELPEVMQGISAVVISDYAKGFVSETLCQNIIAAAKARQIPVLVDPKGKSVAKYRGATAITPNTKEFLEITGLTSLPTEAQIAITGQHFCKENDFEYLIFTRSEKGISTISRDSGEKKDYPTVAKEVVDVTGAGDTVITTLALAMSAGFSLGQCVKMANTAASIVISRFGASQTTIQELNSALHPSAKVSTDLKSTLAQIASLKQQGKRIVFTNGCFDLVHAGHISSFHQARDFGDILVVGVNSDESIRRIKGPKRPIVSLKNRMALLSALEYVDFVIPFEEDTPQALIETICPDVLVKGKDWEGQEIAGGAFVKSKGGQVKFIDLEQGLSTTNIIEKIKQSLE